MRSGNGTNDQTIGEQVMVCCFVLVHMTFHIHMCEYPIVSSAQAVEFPRDYAAFESYIHSDHIASYFSWHVIRCHLEISRSCFTSLIV